MSAVPSFFHTTEAMMLTREMTATSVGVGDAALGANAVVARRQTIITDAVLAIGELADEPRVTSRRGQLEAASIPPANKGIGASDQSCSSDEVLHGAEKANE